MSETIPVITEADAHDEAWEMGYNRFEGVDVGPDADIDVGPFRDSAAYANHTLPRLRALAGFGDAGHGTYQVDQDIVVIPFGCEDDVPAEGERSTANALYHSLVEEWHNGAYSALQDARDERRTSA